MRKVSLICFKKSRLLASTSHKIPIFTSIPKLNITIFAIVALMSQAKPTSINICGV